MEINMDSITPGYNEFINMQIKEMRKHETCDRYCKDCCDCIENCDGHEIMFPMEKDNGS